MAPSGSVEVRGRVQILAGTSEDDAADAFDILVCSPTWFAAHWQDTVNIHERLPGGVVPGRNIWFMERWDPELFQRAIEHVLDVTTAGSWNEIANRLGRYAPWEYDYRYDQGQDELAGLPPIDYPEPEDEAADAGPEPSVD